MIVLSPERKAQTLTDGLNGGRLEPHTRQRDPRDR